MRTLSIHHFLKDTPEGFKDVQNSDDEEEIKNAPVAFDTIEAVVEYYRRTLREELAKMPKGSTAYLDFSINVHD